MSDIFSEENEVRASSFIQWGKEGDFVSGTLTDVREVENNLPGKEGETQKIYDILVDSGEYHPRLDDGSTSDKPTILEKGSIVRVGEKAGLAAQLKYVKIGQKVGFKFAETIPAKKKGFNPFKLVKVYTTGEMDQAWLEEQGLAVKDL